MNPRLFRQRLLPLAGCLLLLWQPAQSGNLSISNVPLGTGSGISVKPNMVFILDDSGSMGWDYMPDYVDDDEMCPDSNNNGTTNACVVGDPPYSAAGFNTVYYNPAIRYRPPKNSDGTEWANASTTTPRKEPFTSSDTSTKTLTSYQNTAWCKQDSDTPNGNPSTDTNCAYYPVGTASSYPLYPDATYKYLKTYNGPPVYYVMSGSPQWCNSSALTSCTTKWSSTYKWPKWGSASSQTGVAAYRTFYIVDIGGSGSPTVDIVYNGSTTLASLSTYSGNNAGNRNEFADRIVAAVGGGFTASVVTYDTSGGGTNCSGDNDTTKARCPQVKITAPGGTTSTTNTTYNNKSLNLTEPSGIDFSRATENLGGGVDYIPTASGVTFTRYQVSSGQTYTKYTNRDDCAGSSCTYAEELQNFANWYSFYRKRMHMTKTSVSRAFASVSDTSPGAGFRIGLMTISAGADSSEIEDQGDTTCWTANSANELQVGDFNSTNKSSFYTKLFAITPCSYTPLRGALSRAGRLYAGQLAYDPIQYSCQQNFAFLSTDGYWNSDIESSSFGPKKEDGSTDVGNQDGTGTARPYLDSSNKSNTLADVAMFYYNHDLRSALDNDVPTSSKDPATYQHMVTFTMGLGVDGTLGYSSSYETGGSADYTSISQGAGKEWPDPTGSSGPARIDDLWHAAVNGRGKYFSASNPDQVASSLNEALVGISAMSGSAAAASTSNLEPVAGDNYAYVASYVTQTWDGNIEARTIDLTTGVLASTPSWSAQALLDTKAAVSPVPSGASGPGSRTLYSFDGALTGTDKKFLLTWANAQAKGWDGSVSGKDYFNPEQVNQCNPVSNCAGATRANLFAYLMGGADATTNHSYRTRAHVLGDIVNSQPVYVKASSFSYSDAGYSTYKTSTASRQAMVYVGANDGFLHAFNADSGDNGGGVETWAYLPAAVAPNLYELAATNYGHRYFTDGILTAGDVKVGSTWKTILVGGLNSGGRHYFALDVTDPASPVALWEFTDGRMGYTYGNPIITKLPAGTTSSTGADIGGKWVAMVTSGYNNGGTSYADHNGQGVLYVLDAYTGTEYFRLYTCTTQSSDASCAGSASSPNGLAKINAWVNNPTQDNTTLYVYGGDLEGNLWRFDIANKSAFKVAAVGEPITVKPELAEIQSKRVVLFGTGLFLQANDKSDATRRSIYAISDLPTATSALTNVKTSGDLVEQTLALVSGSTTQRNIPDPETVSWTTNRGWFVELLEDRERVNVDPILQLGTLVVASNVPDAGSPTACTTGGHSWLQYLDITSGSFVNNSQSNPNAIAGHHIGNALAVGINVVKLPNGKLITIVTTADTQHPVQEAPVGTANLPLRRVSWRELITE